MQKLQQRITVQVLRVTQVIIIPICCLRDNMKACYSKLNTCWKRYNRHMSFVSFFVFISLFSFLRQSLYAHFGPILSLSNLKKEGDDNVAWSCMCFEAFLSSQTLCFDLILYKDGCFPWQRMLNGGDRFCQTFKLKKWSSSWTPQATEGFPSQLL